MAAEELTTEETEKEEKGFFKPEDLFRTIDHIRANAPPLEPLWGDFLLRKAITSIVGDPGICKSTMGYGLAGAGCLGLPFLDIKFEEPTVVLYMDFESADSLVASRASLVFGETKIPNFYIYNSIEFYLKQVAEPIINFCTGHKVNLLFIDNQTAAFNTRDENDNSEAATQMRFVRQLTNACNTATVIFHHTSKANLSGTRKGTGAFARARLADICINLNYPQEDDESIVSFQVAKNRVVTEKPFWYLKKSKGGFAITDPPLGAIGQPRVNSIIYKVQQDILALLNNGQQYKRKDLIMKLPDYETRTVDEALEKLKRLGRVNSPQYGFYATRSMKGQ